MEIEIELVIRGPRPQATIVVDGARQVLTLTSGLRRVEGSVYAVTLTVPASRATIRIETGQQPEKQITAEEAARLVESRQAWRAEATADLEAAGIRLTGDESDAFLRSAVAAQRAVDARAALKR